MSKKRKLPTPHGIRVREDWLGGELRSHPPAAARQPAKIEVDPEVARNPFKRPDESARKA
jgi:hypothetical protein